MTTRSSLQNAPSIASITTTTTQPDASLLSILADPPIREIDGAAMDYLLIELVHTLRASSAVASARARNIEKEMIDAGLLPPNAGGPPTPIAKKVDNRDSMSSPESARSRTQSSITRLGGIQPKAALDDEEEALRNRLEAIGMHVGSNIAERLCRDKSLFSETLDGIKFICKDIWTACWDKQVDNLRTNHRGVYVLQDNNFKPISRLSSWEGQADAQKRAKLYVAMSVGILRGALLRLGFQATVSAEVPHLPQCVFQVKLPKGT